MNHSPYTHTRHVAKLKRIQTVLDAGLALAKKYNLRFTQKLVGESTTKGRIEISKKDVQNIVGFLFILWETKSMDIQYELSTETVSDSTKWNGEEYLDVGHIQFWSTESDDPDFRVDLKSILDSVKHWHVVS